MKKKLLLAPVAAALLAFGTMGFAAQDCDGGVADDAGSIDISLDVQNSIQISGLEDVSFTYQVGDGDQSFAQNVCIFATNSGGDYTITASDDEDGDFLLNGIASDIPYSVEFDDSANATLLASQSLSHGNPSTSLVTTNSSEPVCDNLVSENATLHILVSASDIVSNGGEPDQYTSTLNLLVEHDEP